MIFWLPGKIYFHRHIDSLLITDLQLKVELYDYLQKLNIVQKLNIDNYIKRTTSNLKQRIRTLYVLKRYIEEI